MLNQSDISTLRDKGMSNTDILKNMGRFVPSAQRAFDSLQANQRIPEWQKDALIGRMLDKKVPKTGPSGLGMMAVSGMNEAQQKYVQKQNEQQIQTDQQQLATSLESAGDPLGWVAGKALRTAEYVASPLAAASGLIQKGFGVENSLDVQELPQQSEMARTSLPMTVGAMTAPLSIPASAAAVGAAGAAGQGLKEGSDAVTGQDEQSLGGRVMDVATQGALTGITDASVGLAFKGLGAIAPRFARGLKESAKNTIMKALGPSTKPMKRQAEKVAGDMMERPFKDTFALTRGSLQSKAAAGKELAGEAVDAFGELKGSTPTSYLVDMLEAEKKLYTAGGKVVDPDSVAQIDAVQNIFRQYGDDIDDETMRSVRRIFDSKIAGSKGHLTDLKEGTKLDVMKTAANKIRGILADKNPDLAKLNREYNFWSSLDEVISATNQRTVGQTGLMPGVSAVAGASSASDAPNMLLRATGFYALTNIVRSAGWRLASAKVKSELAEALVRNDVPQLFQLLTRVASQGAVGRASSDE